MTQGPRDGVSVIRMIHSHRPHHQDPVDVVEIGSEVGIGEGAFHGSMGDPKKTLGVFSMGNIPSINGCCYGGYPYDSENLRG